MKKDALGGRELALVVGLGGSLTILNSLHVILQWFKNPAGAVFTGIAHFYADYFLYVAQMSEGAAGSLWYVHRFTDEKVMPTWIYWFNNLVGWLGHLLSLSPFASYNLALVLLVFGLILLVYYLFSLVYPGNRTARWAAFILFLSASPIIDIPNLRQQGILKLPDYLWFSPTLVFNRLGGVPHQVWQTILLILLAIIFSKTLNRKLFYWSDWYLLVGLTILATTANPILILIFIITAGIVCLGLILKKEVSPWSAILLLATLGLTALPAAWLTNREFTNSAIFTASKIWELKQYVDTSLSLFIVSLGAVSIFIPFGLVLGKNDRPLPLFLSLYALVSAVLFFSPIPRLIGTTPIRYLSPFGYIGLIILAVEGIMALAQKLTYIKTYPSGAARFARASARRAGPARSLVTALLTALVVLASVPAFFIQIINRISPTENPYLLMDTIYNHVPPKIAEGLTWLAHQPVDANRPVVLVDNQYRIEVLVPAFSNKTVFLGHPIHTLSLNVKEALRQKFFTTELSASDAQSFLSTHRIGFIIVKSRRMPVPYFTQFPFIQEIYNNGEMTIFRVKQF